MFYSFEDPLIRKSVVEFKQDSRALPEDTETKSYLEFLLESRVMIQIIHSICKNKSFASEQYESDSLILSHSDELCSIIELLDQVRSKSINK